ncbi:MAG: CDP-diacylglycerol--serine O-phosphatidyltransferase [Desulfovibrionaceae bacterium]|nr:CDP-diacylglycerol--serine O-phosphatidyltransferase [Desulfovibrionaceae bacterium]
MSREERKVRRSAYLLPNMITTLSMFLGFLSMVWAVQGGFENACLAILVSALLDGLDGKVARLTHTSSEFGVQYDSLADAVAFGLAPAFLMWQWQLFTFGNLGVACAFIYAACGVLRLARFNITTRVISKRFFIGLPIPAGGCTMVTLIFFANTLPEILKPSIPWLALLASILIGILMVSRVRYFSFKEYDYLRAHPVRCLVAFFFLLGLLFSQPRIFSFVYCLIYIASGLIYSYILLPRRDRQLMRTFTSRNDK